MADSALDRITLAIAASVSLDTISAGACGCSTTAKGNACC